MLVHLSELHGAATHLAVIAIPLYAVQLLLRRAGLATDVLKAISPWIMGFALFGVIAAGITGLLVWGQAQTMLRGSDFRIGTAHFWIGIVLALIVLVTAGLGWRARRQGHELPRWELLITGVAGLILVFAQGYMGGRMTYHYGVGVASAGEFAQTATGASELHVALAKGTSPVRAGHDAFMGSGLGCAYCHGDRAQGLRGPQLAGGQELADFRRVHEKGLFPPDVVTNRDFAAINAWLKTLPAGHGGGGD